MNTQLNDSTEPEISAKNILLCAVIILMLGAFLSFVYVSTSSINDMSPDVHNNLSNDHSMLQVSAREVSGDAQKNFLIGGMVMLSFATLILFLTTKIKINLLLFIYCITRTLLLSDIVNNNLKGGNEYLTNAVSINLPLLIASSSFFMFLFMVEFFSLRNKHPSLYRKIRILPVLLIFYYGMSFFVTTLSPLKFSIIIQSFITIILLVTSIHLINIK